MIYLFASVGADISTYSLHDGMLALGWAQTLTLTVAEDDFERTRILLADFSAKGPYAPQINLQTHPTTNDLWWLDSPTHRYVGGINGPQQKKQQGIL